MDKINVRKYLDSIGMVYAADGDVESVLYKASSNKQLAEKIVSVINDRADGIFDPEVDFYELKNQEPALGRAVAGAYDYNHLLKALNWIRNNLELLKGEVLEVGCDVGAATCFMAKLCPDLHITAIDKCHNGIEAAKELASSLGLANVEFLCCEVKDLVGKKSFDTVVSLKTLNENQKQRSYDCCKTLDEMSDLIIPIVEDYSKLLSQLVSDEGNCITIEFRPVPDFAYAWVKAMGKNCLNLLAGNCQRYSYETFGDYSDMIAFAFRKGEKLSDEILYERYNASFLSQMDLSGGQYESEEAALVFQNSVRSVIKGYDVYNRRMEPIIRICAYNSDDTTAVLLYASTSDSMHGRMIVTQNLDISRKDEVLAEVRRTGQMYKKQGMIVKDAKVKIKYKEPPKSAAIIRFRQAKEQ